MSRYPSSNAIRGYSSGILDGTILAGGSSGRAPTRPPARDPRAGFWNNGAWVNPSYQPNQWEQAAMREQENASRREELLDQMVTGALRGQHSPLEGALADDINNRAREIFGKDIRVTEDRADPAYLERMSAIMQQSYQQPPITPEVKTQSILAAIDGTGPMLDADLDLGDQIARIRQTQAQKFAADYVEVSKQMGEPGMTDRQRRDLQQQFIQRYPQYAQQGAVPEPISREQYAQMKLEQQKSEANAAYRAVMNGEMPENPFTTDRHGNIQMIPGVREAMQQRAEVQHQEAQDQREVLRQQAALAQNQMKQLDLSMPAAPAVNVGQAAVDYNRKVERINIQRKALLQKQAGQVPQYTGPDARRVVAESYEQGHLVEGDRYELQVGEGRYVTFQIVNGIPVRVNQ